jgi:hypothetical protein
VEGGDGAREDGDENGDEGISVREPSSERRMRGGEDGEEK